MVPRWSMASSRLMPMPLSRTVSVPAFGVRLDPDRQLARRPQQRGSASARNRSLSLASEALEISSRRKISRWLYSEWIMSCSSSRTSALNPSVSGAAAVSDMGDSGEAWEDPPVIGPGGPYFKCRAGDLPRVISGESTIGAGRSG